MKLILATKNEHKVEEFQRILAPLGWQVIPQDAVCPPDLDIEETGKTFAENAYLKAMGIYRATGLPTVADDSGLCVDALNGAPGCTPPAMPGRGTIPPPITPSCCGRWKKSRMKGARHGLSAPSARYSGRLTLCGARAPAKGPLPAGCTDRTALGMTRCYGGGAQLCRAGRPRQGCHQPPGTGAGGTV